MTLVKSMKATGPGPRRVITVLALLTLAVAGPLATADAQIYGNGSDGDFVVAGTYHVPSDRNYNNLTINPGSTLETHGFNIRVNGTLINNGTITDSFSGGNGGSGGPGGNGGVGFSPHIGPQSGSFGSTGFAPSVAGGGVGGAGGGGGGGGGGAWDISFGEQAFGGKGGNGGTGGKGGGVVRIFARTLDNSGTIHARGFNGTNGQNGLVGDFESYGVWPSFRDMAGGGGGGGQGGYGGNGGTADITYETLLSTGTVSVQGGNGGPGGFGASGLNTSDGSASGQSEENGAFGAGSGGNGGRSEVSSGASNSGNNAGFGIGGNSGSITWSQSTVCYVDADGDGFGDAGDPGTDVAGGCGAGFSTNNFDCNDNDNSISPIASEIVGDGIDQNCDGGELCYADNDNDGFGDFTTVASADMDCNDAGEAWTNGDCNDGDAGIFPGATEVIGDGIDQNCDGGELCYADNDNDGFGGFSTVFSADLDCFDFGEATVSNDCDDNNPTVYPGATEVVGDGIDQNCDGGEICYSDSDGDGFGSVATVASADLDCSDAGESVFNIDCDDADNTVYPGAPELCDGIDNDCDFTLSPTEIDVDGDGIVECTIDGGGWDGVGSVTGGDDNCPTTFNAAQTDTDLDGIGDACDGFCCLLRADVDNSGTGPDIADLVYLVAFMFSGGPAPPCMGQADIDGSGSATPDIADLVYLVAFMFSGGPAPAPC